MHELSLGEIIQKSWRKDPEVFNNAGQHWNHSFLAMPTPHGGGAAERRSERQIDKDFRGLSALQKEFAERPRKIRSGWAWLVLDGDTLKVVTTSNAELPMLHGQQAILACDVWEHAYYLAIRTSLRNSVDSFLKKLANWKFAAERFELRGEGDHLYARDYQSAQHAFAKSGAAESGARHSGQRLGWRRRRGGSKSASAQRQARESRINVKSPPKQ